MLRDNPLKDKKGTNHSISDLIDGDHQINEQ